MNKKIFCRLLCGVMILVTILLSACSAVQSDTLRFEAMDTVMSLTVYDGEGSCAAVRAKADELDKKLSAVDKNSEIYALNSGSAAALTEEPLELVTRSLELCGELDGSFDITVYPAVREWGFTTGEYTVPSDERLTGLARNIDWSAVKVSGVTVSLPEGYMIDLGAAAKGYLADKARGILADTGATGAVLNLGGTVLLYGSKPDGSPFKVGIADPKDPAAYFGYLSLNDGVAATSGGYERYFEKDGKRYIHILDPATAKPVDNGVESVTVIADEGTKADALSTALFVMGAKKAGEYYQQKGGFEYALLTSSGELYISEGLSGVFALSQGYDYDITTVNKIQNSY